MEHTLALPHGTLAWESWGSSRADTTLVLIHGFPHDRWLWHAQAAAVGTTLAGARLLIPDLPGFGGSSPLAAAPHMDAYADAIAALLDEAGVRQAVIGGLSMGGYVALAFWRRHPTRVRALMLLDTKAPADTDAAREKRRELIAAVTTNGMGPLVPALVTQQLGASTRETRPALVEQVEVMLRRAPAAGVAGAAEALMTRIDSTPTLATITVPTLVIVGDEDAVTPLSDAVAMSAAIPGSRLVTVPGAGHLAPLEQPEVVNAAIAEFLDVAVRAT
jgi:pimeloyl-ACP methyl ester carboxylesterase